MKVTKLIYAYYWILFLTPVIFIVREYLGDWLETQIYIKQYGTLIGRKGNCVPLPPFIADFFLIAIAAIAYLWTSGYNKRLQIKSTQTNLDYFELALLTVVFILPFLFLDIKLFQGILLMFLCS